MPDLTQVTQMTGVGIAGLAVYLMWKLVNNSLTHNTSAINELRDVIRDLKEFLMNHLTK